MFFHFSKAQSAVSSRARQLGETITGYVTAKKGNRKKSFAGIVNIVHPFAVLPFLLLYLVIPQPSTTILALSLNRKTIHKNYGRNKQNQIE